MHERWLTLAASLGVAVMCASCAQPANEGPMRPGTGRLLVVGSSAMAPLVTELGKRFEQAHPGVRIEVQAGESARGLAEIADGKADVGMVSRAPADGGGFSYMVARDAVSVVVHKTNPVASLSREQVASIYTGRVTNWKQVGGKDGTITVISGGRQDEGADQFARFHGIPDGELKAHLTIGDDTERLRVLATRPGAIAFTSAGVAAHIRQWGVPVKPLPAEPGSTTRDSPLARPLLLVTRSAPSGLAKQFIDYALSPAAASVIQSHNFVTDSH